METGTENKTHWLNLWINGSYHNSTAIAYDAVMMSTYSEWIIINSPFASCMY